MRHCLFDGLVEITPQQEEQCWDELDHILTACGRQSAGFATLSEDPSQKRAAARTAFVACLAEWVNMHAHHRPFPMGPPSKDQACCAVEHEHSAAERRSCKLHIPRKGINPGEE